MYSVGAPHTWPLALGALMWLIDNIKVGKKKTLLIKVGIVNVARRYQLKPALCLLFIRSSGVWVSRRCCSVISARTATTLRKGLNITRFCYPTSTNFTALMLSCSCETQCLFYVQLFLDYTAETYSKFMQCEDTFDEEDEVFLSKLSEHWHQYDFSNCGAIKQFLFST